MNALEKPATTARVAPICPYEIAQSKKILCCDINNALREHGYAGMAAGDILDGWFWMAEAGNGPLAGIDLDPRLRPIFDRAMDAIDADQLTAAISHIKNLHETWAAPRRRGQDSPPSA